MPYKHQPMPFIALLMHFRSLLDWLWWKQKKNPLQFNSRSFLTNILHMRLRWRKALVFQFYRDKKILIWFHPESNWGRKNQNLACCQLHHETILNLQNSHSSILMRIKFNIYSLFCSSYMGQIFFSFFLALRGTRATGNWTQTLQWRNHTRLSEHSTEVARTRLAAKINSFLKSKLTTTLKRLQHTELGFRFTTAEGLPNRFFWLPSCARNVG